MRIGMIGAGFVARAVGKLAVAQGHEVMMSNSRGPHTLMSLKGWLGCEIGTVAEAASFGEIVLVAIPLAAYASVPAVPLVGKIVLDANNYYPERDGQIDELDRVETTTSELLARHLPGTRIVKAFNAIMMKDLETDGRPSGLPGRRALPIAGDDADAKAVVIQLQDAFGFDTLDACPLAEGWRFERATPGYCVPLDKTALQQTFAETTRTSRVAEGSWRT